MGLDARISALAASIGVNREALAKEINRAKDPTADLAGRERRASRLRSAMIRRADEREADQRAENARARFEAGRVEQERAERRIRERMTLGGRLDAALTTAATLAAARSAAIGAGGKAGKPESKAPPDAQSDVLERWTMVMGRLVENLEREVDRTRRSPLDSDFHRETMEERDERLMRDWAGWPSHLVTALDPTLGSPRTVENARSRIGVRRIDGLPLGSEKDRELRKQVA